jgi:hypothetical protein
MTVTATTSAPASPPDTAPVESDDRLATEASKLRGRRAIAFERWFQLAGAVLPFLGVLAIIAAWYGVSHTARSWRQTPYVVSGGLLGLGLIFLGGFSYFAFWMTKLVQETHQQTAVLERIEAALTGRRPGDVGEDALVVDSANVVHRGDCPLLAGRPEVQPLGRKRRGLSACPVCDPTLP